MTTPAHPAYNVSGKLGDRTHINTRVPRPHILERAVILSPGPVLQVPLTEFTTRITLAPPTPHDTLEAAERKDIRAVLGERDGCWAGRTARPCGWE
jgi:hypothetical protein